MTSGSRSHLALWAGARRFFVIAGVLPVSWLLTCWRARAAPRGVLLILNLDAITRGSPFSSALSLLVMLASASARRRREELLRREMK
jgi:hypothetical protein